MKKARIDEKISDFSILPLKAILKKYNISITGLSEKEAELRKKSKDSNKHKKKDTTLHRLRRSFINPFSIVLFILAVIYLLTDIIYKDIPKRNYMPVSIIFTMLMISGIIRFSEEMKSKRTAENLINLVDKKVFVKRDGKWIKKDASDLCMHDIIKLTPGERVPADIRIINSDGLYISESAVTGESKIKVKTSEVLKNPPKNLFNCNNIAFSGTTVISGICEGIVISDGNDTVYQDITSDLKEQKNGFNKGSNSIARVLIKFMILLIPVVFIASGLTKGNWLFAFLFSLSVAVGLTPELLPMVITSCLAKGSSNMSKKRTIVKNINAMQTFGSMDIICLDKTGTLTNDTLTLEYYMDILGNEDKKVLEYAFLNSFFHSGIKNHLDNAILNIKSMPDFKSEYIPLTSKYKKQDELPFDYNRKISTVLLKDENKYLLISKGNVINIVKRCKYIEYKNKKYEITKDDYRSVHEIVDEMEEDGMKVLAVAKKEITKETLSSSDEYDLTLLGYITFFDAPKETALSALNKLNNLNVKQKILTGDNKDVAISICKRLNIDTTNVITGEEFEKLSDNDAQVTVENTSVFTELTPEQKAEIISLLKSNGHTVGFLADGINDIPGVLKADVGISVDSASPALQETADVILLKKDLNVLEEGIIEGRKSFANMEKYIKITASSNLGNIIAIVFASIFLPFFPMTSIQILLLNLLYDILCLVLPWDFVDYDICKRPLEWSGKTLTRFMLCFGPVSSLFDIITFVFLLFFLCPTVCNGSFFALAPVEKIKFISVFQTGWFLESMWTQILILYLLRTNKLSLLKSKPSPPVLFITITGIILFTFFTMTPLGRIIGLTKLPLIYYLFLIPVILCYLLLITFIKRKYIKKYQHLI